MSKMLQIAWAACVLPDRPAVLGKLFNAYDPAAGLRAWQKAMDGNTDFYAGYVPRVMREPVLRAAVIAKMPRPAFREMVSQLWTDNRHERMTLDGARRIFEYAEFDVSHLPEKVSLYRGALAKPTTARKGISWTLDRDVAAWFAMRPAGGQPVVLKVEVTRSSIAAFFDHTEQECVVFGVRGSRVDLMPDMPLQLFTGAPNDVFQAWQEASDRHILRNEGRVGGWEEANTRTLAREKSSLAA